MVADTQYATFICINNHKSTELANKWKGYVCPKCGGGIAAITNFDVADIGKFLNALANLKIL